MNPIHTLTSYFFIYILLLNLHLRLCLPNGLLPSGFPTKLLLHPSSFPWVPYATHILFSLICSPFPFLTFFLRVHPSPRPCVTLCKEVLKKVKMSILVFEDGGSMFLRNVGIYLKVYKAFELRRPISTLCNESFPVNCCYPHAQASSWSTVSFRLSRLLIQFFSKLPSTYTDRLLRQEPKTVPYRDSKKPT
jgi:hypothetical protein